jgi:shikimate dehydrogenase
MNLIDTPYLSTKQIISDQYAVIGNPIQHSKSPRIHTLFAAQTEQSLEYGKILGETEKFSTQVRAFFSNGGKGLNVTLPFKQEAWRLANQSSNRANQAQAANTLMLSNDGKILADNTDGLGLIRDLVYNHAIKLQERSILLLGAGGAARGVIGALLEQTPAYLCIANRTPHKATELVNACTFNSKYAEKICGGGLDIVHNYASFDIIINATSASLTGKMLALPNECLHSNSIIYDMLYADQPTPFMRWGLECGAKLALDGLGMLVEQAAEAFLLWRGVRPDTKKVLQILRSTM